MGINVDEEKSDEFIDELEKLLKKYDPKHWYFNFDAEDGIEDDEE
jgi:hypothetical protein